MFKLRQQTTEGYRLYQDAGTGYDLRLWTPGDGYALRKGEDADFFSDELLCQVPVRCRVEVTLSRTMHQVCDVRLHCEVLASGLRRVSGLPLGTQVGDDGVQTGSAVVAQPGGKYVLVLDAATADLVEAELLRVRREVMQVRGKVLVRAMPTVQRPFGMVIEAASRVDIRLVNTTPLQLTVEGGTVVECSMVVVMPLPLDVVAAAEVHMPILRVGNLSLEGVECAVGVLIPDIVRIRLLELDGVEEEPWAYCGLHSGLIGDDLNGWWCDDEGNLIEVTL